MTQDFKICVTGHRGMVGSSAIDRNLIAADLNPENLRWDFGVGYFSNSTLN